MSTKFTVVEQTELFESTDQQIRRVLSMEIDQWGRTYFPAYDAREMYAKEMSEVCEEHITRTTVNQWCSNWEGYQFPANKIKGHVKITGSKRLLEIVSQDTGFTIGDEADSLFAERGRLLKQISQLQAKVASIDSRISPEGN